MSPTKSYSSWRNDKLAAPERAARYLTAAYKESTEAFVHALKNVIQAHPVSAIARQVGVSRENLYRTENPTITTLRPLLHALGVDIPDFVAIKGAVKSSPPSAVPARLRTGNPQKRGTRGAIEQLEFKFEAPLHITGSYAGANVPPIAPTNNIVGFRVTSVTTQAELGSPYPNWR